MHMHDIAHLVLRSLDRYYIYIYIYIYVDLNAMYVHLMSHSRATPLSVQWLGLLAGAGAGGVLSTTAVM